MRFLCDEMLQRLGRWLRAAGYDTLIENAARADRLLLAQAVREQRRLVTRDRKLAEHRAAPGTVVLLEENSVEGCARKLSARLPIDWLYRPFSRCTLCNTPLEAVPTGERPQRPTPPGLNLHRCPACGHCTGKAPMSTACGPAWSTGGVTRTADVPGYCSIGVSVRLPQSDQDPGYPLTRA